LKVSDKLENIQQEKVNLRSDALQEIYTTNEDINPTLSKAREETLFKFVNKPSTQSVRKTNHHELE
jgi:hypothetical protein